MAWPERIVLIVFVGLIVLAAEIAVMIFCKEARISGWISVVYVLAAMLFDLWAVLRTIDHLSAGPARRRQDRIVKFSP